MKLPFDKQNIKKHVIILTTSCVPLMNTTMEGLMTPNYILYEGKRCYTLNKL